MCPICEGLGVWFRAHDPDQSAKEDFEKEVEAWKKKDWEKGL